MPRSPGIVIIGAGPTGLGAAWRLTELGHRDWLLIDAAPGPGGLASSCVDEHGFTWDLGGHVLFSHYEYFDRLMDQLLPGAWTEHVREAWVWIRDRFIPYPLQNNVWRLPADDLLACLDGLLAVRDARGQPPPENFRDWILQTFGRGLADVFMLPYNRKVWAYDSAELGVGWMGERVATVDLGRILHNLVRQQDDVSWGPNARFRFPTRGGTGSIWRALYDRLPNGNVRLGRSLEQLDLKTRRVTLDDGSVVRFENLISTMPVDQLLKRLADGPLLASLAPGFKYSSSHIVGVGLVGRVPDHLATKCWMYFPEAEFPFYRVTVFSNYSPYHVPHIGRHWSLLCEVSESPTKPVDGKQVVEEVVAGLARAGLLPEGASVLSRWHRRLEHGYPTPFLGRDALLETVDAALRGAGVLSRGRFGAWKYEVSNQDHSLMQGVEAVDHLLFGTEETTYRYPNVVNSSKGIGRRPAAGISPAARAA